MYNNICFYLLSQPGLFLFMRLLLSGYFCKDDERRGMRFGFYKKVYIKTARSLI